MNLRAKQSSSSISAYCYCLCSFCFFFLSFQISNTQNAITDPSEVKALNSIFQKWNVQAVESVALWNISGESCSGSAINGTKFNDNENPSIKCDCSYNNGSTCHITQLNVYSLNKKGVIPEEILVLRYLTTLYMDENYFTGSLPAFIGNLSKLQTLSLSANAFYGTIPKELGNLKNLTWLSISRNNFSGTLPPELGDLVNLEILLVDSSGLGGEIPSTFANLRNMIDLTATDILLTGKIPDFIGNNWTKLLQLRLQGNSFEGPIPSSFSKLTSMKSLWICDLYNVSSSLDFIRNLTNLKDLVLRNALITGNIPSDIGEYKSLKKLDLSFNNLTGQIPSALLTMSNLTYLFIGNNSLSGTLPEEKSETLQYLDLSYNNLSGSFPTWVTTSDLQLNLVANNFSSSISTKWGLNCLQRNFPCSRNSPRYSEISINCGGPTIKTADGTVYEADNTVLSVASYFVDISAKWAVSNVGYYDLEDTQSVQSYLWKTTSTQVTGTQTPELFQTSRRSPSSLRYYGLGLENGHYTINLLFAEITFEDRSSQVWQSLGRRVFDIYIQGILQQKDFDISKEAGGVDKAIQKNFSAIVSENYLEIHLFWAGKGTWGIPIYGNLGPMISAIRIVSDFRPTASGPTSLIVRIVVPIGLLGLLLIFAVLYMKRKLKKDDEEELLGVDATVNTFSYAELRTATEDFIPSNKLGEGGFGPVYKGKLHDGRVVAVKQLSAASHQGTSQFITEIATISAVRHRNLVKLYGCCIEGNRRLVVYEYLEHKSLDQALFDSLVWMRRKKCNSSITSSYLKEILKRIPSALAHGWLGLLCNYRSASFYRTTTF